MGQSDDPFGTNNLKRPRRAEGPWSDLALHTIGWKAFQDLCSQVCEVVLERPVEIFREAQDGGQDAVFLLSPKDGEASPIGSVQCKHTSNAARKLQVGDISLEIDNIKTLVQHGQADTYILITNMSVDAPVALKIRNRLQKLGIRKMHVLGKQYLVRAIRTSPRLRALVPQVYGLGDLTSILDERLSQQSRALLDHWIPKLKTYVPTRAHRKAVLALNAHSIVLLLGNPSSGKSAIGAILSTIASENLNHTVLALTSPRDFEDGWNPSDPGRFFWIDDAFGSNVLRDDYVQDWASVFQKVKAAIAHGNRFLLTSRKHIYEAARLRLGQRNLPVFIDGQATVDVGALIIEEKSQILYNHINFGTQSQSWKTSVKPHLDAVARVSDFLPGIAERLGDPAFTKSLSPRENTLVRFMEEPREHLIDTVNALEEPLQAALLLIYVHKGSFRISLSEDVATKAVVELTAIPVSRIIDKFAELKGSFLKSSRLGVEEVWSFAHPTIADALTEILREKPHMMAALVRGATIDTVLTSFACEGALNEPLVARLLQTPNEIERNWSLFWFLVVRANDQVFESAIRVDEDILSRNAWNTHTVSSNPKILAHARANRMGLLSGSLREESASELERAVRGKFDLSFFDNEALLALIPSARLIKLGMKLRMQILPKAAGHISDLAGEADLDDDPESHFDLVSEALTAIEDLAFDDDEANELIAEAREKIRDEIKGLNLRKEERDNEKEDETDWTDISVVSSRDKNDTLQSKELTARSIFDDVDQ
jgi:hypothetical protein